MNSRYLVIDAGNTNTEIGIYSNEGLICSWRLSSDIGKTEDEVYSLLSSLAHQKEINLKAVTVCGIASVVPELTRMYTHLFNKYFTAKVHLITGETEMGLSFLTEDHSFIGADLIVNAYWARIKYKTNVIIVDFGTATTVQLVSSDGLFYGTVIAPGITISSANLFQRASLLSKIQLEEPRSILGTNTKDSLLSGIVRGHSLMTDSFVREIKREYGHLGDFKVIATGGIAPLLGKFLTEIDEIDKTLTIDGLYYYCKHPIP